MESWAVIGLGNPGQKYSDTRHNLGFWILDLLAAENNRNFKKNKIYHALVTSMHFNNNKIFLIKPLTFMNESGRYLSSLLSYINCPSQNVILVHDDLTMPFADLKISLNKGTGGHNGVANVISNIGKSFIRFRIGIGSKLFPEMKLSDFVLSKMSDTELKSLESKKEFFLDAIFNIFENGVVATMNIINQTKTSQPTQ